MAVSMFSGILAVIALSILMSSQVLGDDKRDPCNQDTLMKHCMKFTPVAELEVRCKSFTDLSVCFSSWKSSCNREENSIVRITERFNAALQRFKEECDESGYNTDHPVTSPAPTVTLEKGLTNESCPDGWFLSNVPPYTCLWMSNQTRCSPGDANKVCQEMDSGLMRMETEQKYDYFRTLVTKYETEVWVGLINSPQGLQWHTKGGLVPASALPNDLAQTRTTNWEHLDSICRTLGLAYNGFGQGNLFLKNTCEYCQMKFFCEKPVKCKHGWFGPQCEKKAKCYGHAARYVAGEEVTCPYGCELGWAGQDCSRQIQEPKMNYFCGSNPSGRDIVIWIDTMGSKYKKVEVVPTAEQVGFLYYGHTGNLYSGEEVTGAFTLLYVLHENKWPPSVSSNMQVPDNGNFKMQLLLQEAPGFVSRNDKTFELQCNFSDANQYMLYGETRIKNEKWFVGSSLSKPVESVKEKKERIDLNLVDPATGQRISWAKIGRAVALQIRFGYNSGSVVTGVVPYSCHAYTTRGNQKQLTDADGCRVENSPVPAFYRNDSTSLLTRPFPMFALPEHKRVKFSCKYRMCFGSDDLCPVGCSGED